MELIEWRSTRMESGTNLQLMTICLALLRDLPCSLDLMVMNFGFYFLRRLMPSYMEVLRTSLKVIPTRLSKILLVSQHAPMTSMTLKQKHSLILENFSNFSFTSIKKVTYSQLQHQEQSNNHLKFNWRKEIISSKQDILTQSYKSRRYTVISLSILEISGDISNGMELGQERVLSGHQILERF